MNGIDPLANPPPVRQARAFKATIVLTRNDGKEPTMSDVEAALHRIGVTAFAMPAQTDGPIVISFSDES